MQSPSNWGTAGLGSIEGRAAPKRDFFHELGITNTGDRRAPSPLLYQRFDCRDDCMGGIIGNPRKLVGWPILGIARTAVHVGWAEDVERVSEFRHRTKAEA